VPTQILTDAQDTVPSNLTLGNLLARNTALNLVGMLIPLVVALVAIPILIKNLNSDRFGALTLAWMVIGYYSLFDLGLGRALTKLVSEKLGSEQRKDIPVLIRTTLFLMLFISLGGTFIVTLLSPFLVHQWLNVPKELQIEMLWSFYLLAFSIPFVTSMAGLQGVLEAHQRFGFVNAVRIPLGIFNFCGPVFVLPFSNSLTTVIGVLVVGRLAAWGVFLYLCFRITPDLRHRPVFSHTLISPLIRFGGWMTVSTLVTPFMLALDRFLIGALLSLEAVTYFTTPYDMVMKLLLIPGAFVGVLFPAFSTSFVSDQRRTLALFNSGVKYLFMVLFPLTLIIVLFGFEGLNLWLGIKFAENSTRVLQWLAISVFINGLALVPFSLLQGVGRPDLTAKLHLCELPVYLVLLWWLIKGFGIEGAAIAAVLRITIDAVFLFVMGGRIMGMNSSTQRRITLAGITSLGTLLLATVQMPIHIKILFILVTLLLFVLAAWVLLIGPEEREIMRRMIRSPAGYLRRGL
jgi:O-antigen/teichoic acid export membrane protein